MSDKPNPFRIPRVDARNKMQRDLATYLRQQHLPGVDADDDASVVLETEQARLVLLASGAIIAFEVTQLLASKRVVCVTPLYWSMFLLMCSIAGSWLSLILSEMLRRFRVDRRYSIYHADLNSYISLVDNHQLDYSDSEKRLLQQLEQERLLRARLRGFRYAVAVITALGIGGGVLSAIGTADLQRCHFELLKPQE